MIRWSNLVRSQSSEPPIASVPRAPSSSIGFAGAIYPINPKYQTVRNLVCYPSLTDLPEAPDVVVFSILKPLLPEQVRLAVKRGARAAVIYDAGFAELGEDGARQQTEIGTLF